MQNDNAMPHVDFIAKLELESIYDILVLNRETGMFLFNQFLTNVHVLRSNGLESFSDEALSTLENPQAEEASREDAEEYWNDRQA